MTLNRVLFISGGIIVGLIVAQMIGASSLGRRIGLAA